MIKPAVFSPRVRSITTSFLALSAAVFSVWIFWSVASGVSGGVENLKSIEARAISLERDRKKARAFEALSEERRSDFQRLRLLSPHKERPVELIEQLEELAKNTKNSIAIDVDEGRSKTNGGLFFRLTAEGSLASTRDYLRALELMPYVVGVEDLVLQEISAGVLPGSSPAGQEKAASIRPTHRLLAVISVKTF